jgi:hypothetical protein
MIVQQAARSGPAPQPARDRAIAFQRAVPHGARQPVAPWHTPMSAQERWLELQRGIGNQAVSRLLQRQARGGPFLQRKCACGGEGSGLAGECEECRERTPFVQPKLTIGAPHDAYEQEADRVAEQVTRAPEAGVSLASAPPQISRKCADCEAETGEEELQRKPANARAAGREAPALVNQVLGSPGRALDAASRAYFEPRFGRDFSRVRIHDDTRAAQSARDLGAQAYTVGQSIVFAAGRFAPGTKAGQRLMAHELAHVVQQGAGRIVLRRQPSEAEEADDLYPINYRYIAGMGPGDRITGRRLFEWARAQGYARVVADSSLRRMQEKPGVEEEIIDDIYLLLTQRLWGTAYDPETGAAEKDQFEGSVNARGRAVFEMQEHWDERVARFLRGQLVSFFERQMVGAFSRAPPESSLELRPDVISRIRHNPYRHTTPTGRWNIRAKVGERYGKKHIVDIYKTDPASVGTVWFYLSNYPSWYYQMSSDSFVAGDPVVTEVAAQVAENTRFAAEMFPLMIKIGAFGLGMSASLTALIASVALEELAEEGTREARGEKHRSGWEIFKSASAGLVLGWAMNRVFDGGGAARESGAGAKLFAESSAKEAAGAELVAKFQDRAAGAVRHEVVAAEAPQVAAELRAGRIHPVENKALADEGYVAEVEIISEGQVHIYRRKSNGGWCRFSQRMCFDPDEIPGSEWDDLLEEAAKAESAAARTGGGVGRDFVSGGVRFEIRGSQRAFAALERAPAGAQVYVIRDTSGRAMYVGIVEQNTAGRTAINRLQEHLREKASEFLGDASSIEIKGVGLEVREARSLEDDLITDLKPKWNKRERDPQSYSRKYQAEPVAEEVSGAGNISLRFEIGMR